PNCWKEEIGFIKHDNWTAKKRRLLEKNMTLHLRVTWVFCRAGFILITTIIIAANAFAQAPPASSPPTPQPTPTPSPEKKILTNILQDQRAIWTSPLRLQADDAKFLAALGLSTAALIATDRRSSNELVENGDNPTRLSISNNISRLGS